jgi:hypothetical protein
LATHLRSSPRSHRKGSDDDEACALAIDLNHRVYAIARIDAAGAGRVVEVNKIVMPTHQWTLLYTWPADQLLL